MQRILFIIFAAWTILTHAVPDIAVSNLMLLHDVPGAFNNKAASTAIVYNSPQIEALLKAQNTILTKRIASSIAESGAFTVSDGDTIVAIWLMSDPEILKTLYADQEISIESKVSELSPKSKTESAIAPKIRPTTNSQKYVLIGWVVKITESQVQQAIWQTGKTSFLYNIDISAKYKIIDRDSQKVVGQFLANGHAGSAQILPNGQAAMRYDTLALAHTALKTLAANVKHGLFLERQNGLFDLPKVRTDNAKK